MTESLDELYFKWLYSQVGNVKLKNPSLTHWALLKLLHQKEFIWIVPNDDNRLEDGRALRYEFVEENIYHYEIDPDWIMLGCSMLEMLIGLSRRLWFEDDMPTDEWFWKLMENLGLFEFNDAVDFDYHDVERVLDDVIWRTYKKDGRGGLFPLRHPDKDQRDVEIWYQLSAYLLENGG